MKPLEEMTLGQRFVLTFIIVLVILFALALVGWTTGGWDQAPAASAPSPFDQHLLELDKAGLESAYKSQIAHVYEIWMRDYHTGVTTRAATGFANARAAYIEAQARLAQREKELKQ